LLLTFLTHIGAELFAKRRKKIDNWIIEKTNNGIQEAFQNLKLPDKNEKPFHYPNRDETTQANKKTLFMTNLDKKTSKNNVIEYRKEAIIADNGGLMKMVDDQLLFPSSNVDLFQVS